MFIAVTTIKLPKEQLDHVAEAFRRAAPDLKKFDGFLGFELWRRDDTLQAVSRWETREAMQVYADSSMFRAHHGGPGGQGGQAGQVSYYEGEVVV